MESNFFQEDRYKKILYFICEYKNIDKYDFFKLLKDKECKYLLLLLLENYKCVNIERLSKDFYFKSSAAIKNNIKKAEEKLYVNREFREEYFEIEEMIKKII
jgi:hypothetical protein